MSSYGQVFASAIATAATVPITMQNAAVANGNGTLLPVSGYGSAILSITGTMSGGTTVNFEGSVDDTTFVSLLATTVGTSTTGTSTTATGDYSMSVIGYKSVRARVSNYSAGNVTVVGYPSVLTGGNGGGGGGSSITSVIPGTGATNLGKAEDAPHSSGDTGVFILGVRDDSGTTFCSNGDYSPIAVDSQGRLKTTSAAASPSPTYMATTGLFTPATSATDMAILNGSSTKTIKILAIYYNYTAVTTGINHFHLVKRTSANSSGTGDTEIRLDINNDAPTATLQHYTSNPTLGSTTNGGTVKIVTCAPLGGGVSPTQTGDQILWQASSLGQAITLRGTAEGLAVNNNGTTVPNTATVGFTFLWTEE